MTTTVLNFRMFSFHRSQSYHATYPNATQFFLSDTDFWLKFQHRLKIECYTNSVYYEGDVSRDIPRKLAHMRLSAHHAFWTNPPEVISGRRL